MKAGPLAQDVADEFDRLKTYARQNGETQALLLAADDMVKLRRLIASAPDLLVPLERIASYPVHSEPMGGALDMRDIATAALARAKEGKE